jgi:carbon-monoxide dehydrogenase medium subunit
MGGVLRVYSQEGIHKLPLTDFFTGPGRNQLKPGEIVTGIELPVPPAGHSGKYIKLGRNQLSDLSIVGVTVYGYPDAGTVSGYRFHLALASVAPVPFVPRKAEACLADNPITPEIIEQAADLAQQECSPIDDVRGSSRYRKAMVKNLTFKGLWVVWEKLGHKAN